MKTLGICALLLATLLAIIFWLSTSGRDSSGVEEYLPNRAEVSPDLAVTPAINHLGNAYVPLAEGLLGHEIDPQGENELNLDSDVPNVEVLDPDPVGYKGVVEGAASGMVALVANRADVLAHAALVSMRYRQEVGDILVVALAPISFDGSYSLVVEEWMRAVPLDLVVMTPSDLFTVKGAQLSHVLSARPSQKVSVAVASLEHEGWCDVYWKGPRSGAEDGPTRRRRFLVEQMGFEHCGLLELAHSMVWRSVAFVDSSTEEILINVPAAANVYAEDLATSRADLMVYGTGAGALGYIQSQYSGACSIDVLNIAVWPTSSTLDLFGATMAWQRVTEIAVGGQGDLRGSDGLMGGELNLLGGIGRFWLPKGGMGGPNPMVGAAQEDLRVVLRGLGPEAQHDRVRFDIRFAREGISVPSPELLSFTALELYLSGGDLDGWHSALRRGCSSLFRVVLSGSDGRSVDSRWPLLEPFEAQWLVREAVSDAPEVPVGVRHPLACFEGDVGIGLPSDLPQLLLVAKTRSLVLPMSSTPKSKASWTAWTCVIRTGHEDLLLLPDVRYDLP